MNKQAIHIKIFDKLQDYQAIYQQMLDFTNNRDDTSLDELWILEYSSVITLGASSDISKDLLFENNTIPVIKTDRGGKATYHNEGQLILYPLFNLRRLRLSIYDLVFLLEEAVINFLKKYHITGLRKIKAPGVYVNDKKIASLGLKVKNSSVYHGLSFNITNNLEAFNNIRICGDSDLKMTRLADLLLTTIDLANLKQELVYTFLNTFELFSKNNNSKTI